MKKIVLLTQVMLLLAVVSSVALYWSWREDSVQIKKIAEGIGLETQDEASLGKAIDELNQRIYANQGFEKNKSYFLLKSLGATPLQILEGGGDCADKSRLMAAILEEKGIDATLVMLKPCKSCMWSHTVVEARKGENFRMVVDPVYNLSFPDGIGGYFGVEDLRGDSKILEKRLEELIKIRGEQSKVSYYSSADDGSHYLYATTVNFDKNEMMRSLVKLLQLVVDEPSMVIRPRFLEDPKLFLFIASLLCLFFMWLVYMLVKLFASKRAETE